MALNIKEFFLPIPKGVREKVAVGSAIIIPLIIAACNRGETIPMSIPPTSAAPRPTSTLDARLTIPTASAIPATTLEPATPKPSAVKAPEQEKHMALELDGKSYIRVPMTEGLIPRGDMTIELMARLPKSSDIYDVLGGPLISIVNTDKNGNVVEHSLGFYRQPFFSRSVIESIGPYDGQTLKNQVTTMVNFGVSHYNKDLSSTTTLAVDAKNESESSFETDQEWKHIVAQINNGHVQLFVDGRQIARAPNIYTTAEWYVKDVLAYANPDPNGTITIGSSLPLKYDPDPKTNYEVTYGARRVNGFFGQIGNVRVSDRVRYDGNFDPSSVTFTSDEHTTLFMQLNVDAKDYSGHGHDGELVGNATFKSR